MIDNTLKQRGQRYRHGSIPLPILIAVVVVVLIVAVVVLNSVFYGKSVAMLDQRVVIADIADFAQFIEDCSDDAASPDEIVTMRDDPNGNCLFVRLQVLLKHIYDKKGTQTGQILLRNDDFILASSNRNWPGVLLVGGSEIRPGELVVQSLALTRAPDGSIEYGEPGSGNAEDKPTVGDLVRMVKGAHRVASIGGGRSSRGILDWVPEPLGERSKIIQPPALSGYVWHGHRNFNLQNAWRAAEIVCLFPLPPPGTNAKVVVFGDNETAIPIKAM